jgi:hypothetical protein
MSKISLQDILVEDAKNAKSSDFIQDTLAPGKYQIQVLEFVEEDTYQYISTIVNKKKYNFFYNYYLKDSTDLNADTINFIKALATVAVTAKTTLLEIANSAIGSTYEVEIYNYVSKSGKNKGKTMHNINYRALPIRTTTQVNIDVVEDDLPF